MKQANRKIPGIEKRTKWGKSSKSKPLISLRIELLSQIDRLVARIHLLLSRMTTTTVTLTPQRKLITKTKEAGQVLSMLHKFSLILNKLRRLSRWHTESWNNLREIDFIQAIEIEWTIFLEPLKRTGSSMTSRTQPLTSWTQAMDLQIRQLKARILTQMETKVAHQRLVQTSRSKEVVNILTMETMVKLWLRFQQSMPKDRDQFSISLGKPIFRFITKTIIQLEITATITISWVQIQMLIMVEVLLATQAIWTATIIMINRAQDLEDLVTALAHSHVKPICLEIIRTKITRLLTTTSPSRIPQITRLMVLCHQITQTILAITKYLTPVHRIRLPTPKEAILAPILQTWVM